MSEVRHDSSDRTLAMSREDIEAALAGAHRETLPPPEVQMAIAGAQGIEAAICAACKGSGIVHPSINDAIAHAIPAEEDNGDSVPTAVTR
jgi:hypothetical protein